MFDDPVKSVIELVSEARVFASYGLVEKATESLDAALEAFPRQPEQRGERARLRHCGAEQELKALLRLCGRVDDLPTDDLTKNPDAGDDEDASGVREPARG